MLKYVIVLAGALVVLAASNEAQARGFRRSRGSCPNGQCAAPVYSPSKGEVAAKDAAGATIAAAPAVETPVVAAPVAEATTNVATYASVPYASVPATYRSARLFRFFTRR